jgi:mono/diheme cytochrome c family protein
MALKKLSKKCLIIVLLIVPTFITFQANAEEEHGSGKGSYTRFCANCHGPDGKGNPTAPNGAKTDLTQLAKQNGGTFPTLKVEQILTSKTLIPAHGTPEVPVWGKNFGEPDSQAGHTAARERIALLIKYLNSIQEK